MAPRGTKNLKRGGGRKPGSKNKLPQQVKELVEGALEDVGGRKYLVQQARKHPKAFLALVGKLIPRDLQLNANITHTLVDLIAASHRPPESPHERAPGSSLPN